jgi:hypothetical protein
MLFREKTLKKRTFLTAAVAVVVGMLVISANAQQHDAQREAAFAKIAAGAEFCRRNLQSAPPDVKLGEVDQFCRCMGVQEAALSEGGLQEEAKASMRPQLQQMCVSIIRKQAAGEPNQATVLPKSEPATPLPSAAVPVSPPSVAPQPTVPPQSTNERSAAFMNACVTSPTLMKGYSDSDKATACRCIVDRMPTAGEAVNAESVSRIRDVCVALSRPLPSTIGSWVVTRAADGSPRASADFINEPASTAEFKQIKVFCRDRAVAYQFTGSLGHVDKWDSQIA